MEKRTILIKGAGDLASGIACRLYRSGFSVAMTDSPSRRPERISVITLLVSPTSTSRVST